MDSPSRFYRKTITSGDRNFSLQILRFDNGHFVSVSEGADKIGSMVISMAAGPAPITTTIIPSKSGSLFLKLTAEQICASMNGIAIVSSSVQRELGADTAKILMAEILDMIRNE